MTSSDRPLFALHASIVVLDAESRILLVQEAKPHNHGRWNLPGGHVDHGESLCGAAERELLEETRLTLPIDSLVGIYRGRESVRFIFLASLRYAGARGGG